MTWQKWMLLAWLAVTTVSVTRHIGKPRGPITPNLAAASFGLTLAMAALVVTA